MKVGYIRVSTEEQNESRQYEILKEYDIEKYYVDKASGKNTDRPEYQKMMEYLREGDTLYIASYDRLGRSMIDLLNIINELDKRGVLIVSKKENFDTSTPQGRFILRSFLNLAEMERDLIHERTMEGVRIAKAAGKYKGRKPIELPKDYHKIMTQWVNGEISAASAMLHFNCKPGTFYNWAKQNGYKKASD